MRTYPRGWVLIFNDGIPKNTQEAYRAILEDDDPDADMSPEVTLVPGCTFTDEAGDTKMEVEFWDYYVRIILPEELVTNSMWFKETFKPTTMYLVSEKQI